MRTIRTGIGSQQAAFLFFGFLAAVVGLSLLLKGVMVVVQSKFDGQHRFSFLVTDAQKSSVVLSFEGISKSASVALLPNGAPIRPISRFLQSPLHASVSVRSNQISSLIDAKELDSGTIALFIGKLIISYRNLQTDMTILDLIRLWWIAQRVPKNMLTVTSITPSLNEYEIDAISSSLFSDKIIEQENSTIEIVNATNVTGLGNRLARFISNMGGTVVAVLTADSLQDKSQIIYIEKKTYTVEKLAGLLRLEAVESRAQNNLLSDIRIIIGTGSSTSAPF